MIIDLNDVLYAFSYALDCVEYELLGATTYHGKRVAYISTILGRSLGFEDKRLLDLAACAVLHDNALTQYVKTEYDKALFDRADPQELGIHCTMGEANISELVFHGDVRGVILYHHENPDGSGPFKKTAAETPLMAQLIHFADVLDVKCDLGVYQAGKEKQIQDFLQANSGTIFLPEHIELFLKSFNPKKLLEMQGENIGALLHSQLPENLRDYSQRSLFNIATMFTKIIDFKSENTCVHSRGMAQKCLTMAKFYGYDRQTCQKLYLAGAVHDVGKLVVANDVLEKPGKLSPQEFEYVQTHVWYTYIILSQIKGFEDITSWASNHHEKLNGRGYPFGKTAAELGKNERMLACLDVYQALREKRSYKLPLPHEETMKILRGMVADGSLDGEIVEDIDQVFAFSSEDEPIDNPQNLE
ncbi:MAG: HD domain-containing phosphohydrolase [Oscillospiraceae bacterium]